MDDLLGYRARLGALLPAGNIVAMDDWRRLLLTGVTVHASDFADMPGLPEAARRMAHKRTRGVAALLDGLWFDDAATGLVDTARAALGVELADPRHALQAALLTIGPAPRVALITPFPAAFHAAAAAAITAAGATVVAGDALDLADADQPAIRFTVLRQHVGKLLASAGVDVVVQLGHNLPLGKLTDNLEEDFGVPVLAINHVCLWHLMRLADIEDDLIGAGAIGIAPLPAAG